MFQPIGHPICNGHVAPQQQPRPHPFPPDRHGRAGDENCRQNVRRKTFPGIALLYEAAARSRQRGGNHIRRMATREVPI